MPSLLLLLWQTVRDKFNARIIRTRARSTCRATFWMNVVKNPFPPQRPMHWLVFNDFANFSFHAIRRTRRAFHVKSTLRLPESSSFIVEPDEERLTKTMRRPLFGQSIQIWDAKFSAVNILPKLLADDNAIKVSTKMPTELGAKRDPNAVTLLLTWCT